MVSVPVEDEPDSDRLGPHHYLQGAWLFVLLALITGNDILLIPISVSLYGWYHTWHIYPPLGSWLTLTGLTACLFGSIIVLPYWSGEQFAFLLACVWAGDDVIEHMFGVWTPLDWFWNEHLEKRFSKRDR